MNRFVAFSLYQTAKFWTEPNSKHKFADDKINIAKLIISIIAKVENIMEKEELLVTSILVFSLCFEKSSLSAYLNLEIVW